MINSDIYQFRKHKAASVLSPSPGGLFILSSNMDIYILRTVSGYTIEYRWNYINKNARKTIIKEYYDTK